MRHVMYLLRKSLLSVMLVGTLFAPATHAAQTPGTGQGHGSAFQLATLPSRATLRRRKRGAKARTTAWWRRRGPGAAATHRPLDTNVRPQLSSDSTSARGPPRFR